MVAYVFDRILQQGASEAPARAEAARQWYRQTAQRTAVNPQTLIRSDRERFRRVPSIGQMYMFQYDPKYRLTLPYYDAFPLVIITGGRPGGFMGMNLHYLPPVLRAKFLDALLNVTNNKKYDDTTKFRLTYKLLSGARTMRYFKPCLKHYLLAHVKSRFAEVPAPEWEIATFLPTAQWEKASAGRVYSDSRKASNG